MTLETPLVRVEMEATPAPKIGDIITDANGRQAILMSDLTADGTANVMPLQLTVPVPGPNRNGDVLMVDFAGLGKDKTVTHGVKPDINVAVMQ